MFMEEHDGQRVNINRTDEIIATGAEAVAVACPFCNIMLTDGMKQRNVEEKIAGARHRRAGRAVDSPTCRSAIWSARRDRASE